MEFTDRTHEYISSQSLIQPHDSVLVALSGGPDSVALLHVLAKLRKELRFSLGAVYVNHLIRVDAAAAEEKFCQKLCDKVKVRLHIVRENIPYLALVQKKGLEETGRDYRYKVFESMASHHGYTRVALGHHRDDQVETILFRIIRGTGPSGLQGMAARRGRIIRPLLSVTKADILAYLKKHRLTYCKDSSNESSEFSRNYIRNKLLPEIRERLNPQVDQAILNLSEIISLEEEHLAQVTERAFDESVKTTTGGKIQLDLNRLEGYPLWLRRRLLRFCLQKSSGSTEVALATVDRLIQFNSKRGKACSLPNRVQATIVEDQLILIGGKPIRFSERLVPGKSAIVEQLRIKLKSTVAAYRTKKSKWRRQSTRVVMDVTKVAAPLVIRSIRAGDKFQPLGLRGTKKVSDYLTDRKVASLFRDEIPVVCDKEGIIWLVGFEIADRVKVADTTRKVLRLEIAIDQDRDEKAV
ncbi:MAG: tRNA lysidine(34) synthetase TilS [Candidatus Zixiibacteriota bacterium]